VVSGARDSGEQKLLRRGLDTFAELGYNAASVRVLAQRLDVSHNFINARYGSKMAFWCAVVDFACLAASDIDDPVADLHLDEADQFTAMITRIYRQAALNPQLYRLVTDEAARESDRLDYLYDSFLVPTLAAIMPSIERLIVTHRIPPTPVHVLYFAVTGAVAGVTQKPLARRLGRVEPAGGDTVAEHAETLASLMVTGVLRTSQSAAEPADVEEQASGARLSRHPARVRQQAAHLVQDQRGEYESEWAAICSIAEKFAVPGETMRSWLYQAENDCGPPLGARMEESAELQRLRRENTELRRANEILTSAAAVPSCGCNRQ